MSRAVWLGVMVAACSGKAVVDGVPGSGSGGSGATGNGGNANTTANGAGGAGGALASVTSSVGSAVTSVTSTVSSVASSSSGGNDPCVTTCTTIYDCGLKKDAQMMQLCPGFKGGSELSTFLYGSMMNGCVATCDNQPALMAIIDPSNCAKTIGTLKSLSQPFACVCQKGLNAGC